MSGKFRFLKFSLILIVGISFMLLQSVPKSYKVYNCNQNSLYHDERLSTIKSSSEEIVFMQDFNNETPADYYGTGDNTYRLPGG